MQIDIITTLLFYNVKKKEKKKLSDTAYSKLFLHHALLCVLHCYLGSYKDTLLSASLRHWTPRCRRRMGAYEEHTSLAAKHPVAHVAQPCKSTSAFHDFTEQTDERVKHGFLRGQVEAYLAVVDIVSYVLLVCSSSSRFVCSLTPSLACRISLNLATRYIIP